MHAAVGLLGLMAAAATSKTLHYAVPAELMITSDCIFPADFEVANFTTFTPASNSSQLEVSFHFIDADTGIDTSCQRNSTSKPSPTSASAKRWPCDDPNVTFIYQTTGIAGLTLIEAACPPPDGPAQYEASGLVNPELSCAGSAGGSICVAQQPVVLGDFASLQPVPHGPPST